MYIYLQLIGYVGGVYLFKLSGIFNEFLSHQVSFCVNRCNIGIVSSRTEDKSKHIVKIKLKIILGRCKLDKQGKKAVSGFPLNKGQWLS